MTAWEGGRSMRLFRVLFVSGISRLLCSEHYRVAEGSVTFFACGVEVIQFPSAIVIHVQELRPSLTLEQNEMEVALPFMDEVPEAPAHNARNLQQGAWPFSGAV